MSRPFRPLSAPADRRRHSFRPRTEALEGRQMLTAGMLDPSFGTNGVALTTLSTSTYPDEAAHDVQIQTVIEGGAPTTKIVVVGYAATAKTSNDFALARYNANGSLDTTFGAGGKARTDFGGTRDSASALAIQADGKIVVVGTSNRNTSTKAGALPNNDFAIARYYPNGSLDTSFGAGGKITTAISTSASANSWYNYADTATEVVIQPDGKILVGGNSFNGTNMDFAVVRYNPNGTLDSTFGAGGKLTTAMGAGDDRLYGLALQSDGRIVVAGQASGSAGGSSGLALARYTATGQLDPTFGLDANGKVMTTNTLKFRAHGGLVIQTDGKIAVAGDALIGNNYEFALARYDANGSLDFTFNPNGLNPGIATVGTPSSQDFGQAVVLQPDGKFVIAGDSKTGTSSYDTALARINADGSPDDSFGTNGFLVRSFGSGDDEAWGLAIDPDGRIITAGVARNSTTTFAVSRFQGDAPAPSRLTAATVALEGTGHVPLTRQVLRPILREALAGWRARGVDPRRLAALDVRIADLPGDEIGMASGTTITIDRDAARHGWFVDPTPRRDGDTFAGMDLLTAVAHEIGHALGHDHAEGGLMRATLAKGVRELPREGRRHEGHSPIVGLARRPESPARVGESLLHELASDHVRSGMVRSRGHRRSVGAR